MPVFMSQVDELTSKYQTMSLEEVAEGWKEVYERSLTSCMHGASCQTGPSCQVTCLLLPLMHSVRVMPEPLQQAVGTGCMISLA